MYRSVAEFQANTAPTRAEAALIAAVRAGRPLDIASAPPAAATADNSVRAGFCAC